MTNTIPSERSDYERSDYYLFLDYETTGEPHHKLLEVGWMLTDVDLEPLSDCTSLVIQPPQLLSPYPTPDFFTYNMSDSTRQMHTKNGLLEEVKKSSISVLQAQNAILENCHRHIDLNNRVTLAGFTCHFDRDLIRRDMKQLDKLLHYRHFDVSVPRGMYSNWVEKIPSRKNEHPHRAKDDVLASWRIAKTFKGLFETLMPNLSELDGIPI